MNNRLEEWYERRIINLIDWFRAFWFLLTYDPVRFFADKPRRSLWQRWKSYYRQNTPFIDLYFLAVAILAIAIFWKR